MLHSDIYYLYLQQHFELARMVCRNICTRLYTKTLVRGANNSVNSANNIIDHSIIGSDSIDESYNVLQSARQV
jgi:hypothetical protein